MLWSSGGRGMRPICDGYLHIKKKIQVCIDVWSQLYDDELGDILTPEQELKNISNKCKKHQVVFKILVFSPKEEDAFHCNLSALKFNGSQVKPEEEFYLSPGSTSQPDSAFVLKDMKYDSDFNSEKYFNKKTKLSRLILLQLVSNIGVLREHLNNMNSD